MMANLLRFHEVQVEDVMTPRTVVFMAEAKTTLDELLSDPRAEVFSRIPVYREHRDNVAGYVLQREILTALARDGARDKTLEQFLRPVLFVPELASVGSALGQILQRREPIAMVADEHGGVAGLVTLEDLTESIIGQEIVDESDLVIDMRQAAAKLRDERLSRLLRKRGLRPHEPDDDPR
jgi:CBS domain containing-hemolysin-like protein